MDIEYNANAVYWIFVQTVLGVGSGKLVPVIHHFGSARNFCESRYEEVRETGLLSRKELERFGSTSLDDCRKIMYECEKYGYNIITPNDRSYPKRLAQIQNPPAVLYICGELPDIDDEVAIAVVGTRKCSEMGKSIARELSNRLASAGVLIISGGAKGIDSSAHIGALRAGSKTCAVLGCGLNYPYLLENAELRRDIAQHGALISEFPPDAPSSKYTFPIRNRLMSALSLGTVVVEAPEKSGALITVDHALEQGKDIFVIPGDITDPLYEGSNRLIRDGAIPVITPQDILAEYNSFYPHKLDLIGAEKPISCCDPATVDALDDVVVDDVVVEESPLNKFKAEAKPTYEPEDLEGLSPTALKVLKLFESSDSQLFDVVTEGCDIEPSAAIAALTELELFGIIQVMPGGRYILI